MSSSKDAPDLGTYSRGQETTESDDEAFAELERELEDLNEADADDAARLGNTSSGRGRDDELAQAFREYREKRLAEIQAEHVGMGRRMWLTNCSFASRQETNMNHDPDRGKYREILDEKELLHTTVKEPRCAVHFYHKDFRRCHILDRHLEHLARQHPGTLFVKADVERTPFLVEKLGIRVLPCVMAFDHGVCKDRLIGFEEFGNSDQFSTAALEWRLGRIGIITPQQHPKKPILGFGAAATAPADPADDWDD